MKKIVVYVLTLLCLGGCSVHSSLTDPVIIGVSSPLNEVTVAENRNSHGSSSHNVFSCGFGIMLFDDSDIAPSPIQFIDRYVKKNLKLDPTKVTLTRFDVYFNRQLPKWRDKGNAFAAGLGLLGTAISDEMKRNATDEGTDVVGCKGAESGEFSVFELGETPDFESTPIVAHIELEVNGKKYKGRGFKDTYSVTDYIGYVRGDIRQAVLSALSQVSKQIDANKSDVPS